MTMRQWISGMMVGWLILSSCPEAQGQAVPPGYFNVKSYGAIGDGSTDDTGAINAAITAAAAGVPPSGAQGAVVYFPPGQYEITSTIVLPNRVALHGPNGRGAKIQAMTPATCNASNPLFGCPNSPYLYMFHAYRLKSDGTLGSMFGSRLQDLDLDFNDLAIANSAIIEADSWQETDGLERVVLERFTQYGLIIANGGGGAAYLPLKDIEVFGSSFGSRVGIKVGALGVYGGFILSIDGGSFSGGAVTDSSGNIVRTAQLPVGIELQDTLVAKGLHFEQTTVGISHFGNGGLSVDTATGASSTAAGNVETLIALGSTFTGVLNARNLIGNGTSGPLITNNATGHNIAGGSPGGNLAEYVLDMQSTPAGSPNSVLY
jgi:hypothetical protein